MSSDNERELAEVLAKAQDESLQLQPGETPPDRITVAGSIYHQSTDGEPVQVSLKFERLLETREQVFHRRLKVGENWTPLIPERCWLQKNQVGMIVVRNDEGRYASAQLSQGQQTQLKHKVLEIALGSDESSVLLVPPKESQPLTAVFPERLRLRSRSEGIRYTIFVFPR